MSGRVVPIERGRSEAGRGYLAAIPELAELCRGLPLPAHVNLIALNPTPGYPTRGTPREGVRRFRNQLDDLGVNATVRRNRGTDIDAACGQLAARVELRERTARPASPGGVSARAR